MSKTTTQKHNKQKDRQHLDIFYKQLQGSTMQSSIQPSKYSVQLQTYISPKTKMHFHNQQNSKKPTHKNQLKNNRFSYSCQNQFFYKNQDKDCKQNQNIQANHSKNSNSFIKPIYTKRKSVNGYHQFMSNTTPRLTFQNNQNYQQDLQRYKKTSSNIQPKFQNKHFTQYLTKDQCNQNMHAGKICYSKTNQFSKKKKNKQKSKQNKLLQRNLLIDDAKSKQQQLKQRKFCNLSLPNSENYVKKIMRHNYKGSQLVGPNQPVTDMRKHRRIATTTCQEQNERIKGKQQNIDYRQLYKSLNYDISDQQQSQFEFETDSDQDQQLEDEYDEPPNYKQRQEQTDHKKCYRPSIQCNLIQKITNQQNRKKSKSPNFKKKRQAEVVQTNLTQQMQARLRDIQQITLLQTKNLRQQKQYLLKVIKKLQYKNQTQRQIIQKQAIQVKKLTEQKDIYKSRCTQLQTFLSGTLTSHTDDKNVQKRFSTLNLQEYNPQISMTSDFHNQSIHLQTNQQNNLRQYLHKILQQKPPLKPPQKSPSMTSIANPNLPSRQHITPTFSQNNLSPTKQQNLSNKIINVSLNGDPISSIFSQSNFGLACDVNSFGGYWTNTNSGLSVIKSLQGQIPISLQYQDCNKQQGNLDLNSQKQHIQDNEQRLQHLNLKFEQLMKIYRTNNDTSLRMQCVNIAKQIKQLKKQQIINRQLTDNNSNKISCIEVQQQKQTSNRHMGHRQLSKGKIGQIRHNYSKQASQNLLSKYE